MGGDVSSPLEQAAAVLDGTLDALELENLDSLIDRLEAALVAAKAYRQDIARRQEL